MDRGRSVGVEEEGWVRSRAWQSGEIDGFLAPMRWVCFVGVGGRDPVGKSWPVGWVCG